MARYQVTLAYEGSRFKGSQRQAGARTVQGELEKALRMLGWAGGSVLLAGRTDAGVHAAGQVAAFDMDWQHPEDELLRALNANLPKDLAVRLVQQAFPGFHPRFDALSRCYRYRLFCNPTRDPLREIRAWRAWPEVDAAKLQEAARVFTGRHDFAAFGSPTSRNGTTVRTVQETAWSLHGDEWQFEIRADAFLYRMVRRLVYVQVAVSQGRCPVEALAAALTDPLLGRDLPAGLAPANGLTLVEVTY